MLSRTEPAATEAPAEPGPALFRQRIGLVPGQAVPVAGALVFLLGFLPLPFGSIATSTYLLAGLVAIVLVLRGGLRIPAPAGFAAIACLAYFGLDLLSFVFYGNRAEAWMPPVTSAEFLLLPAVIAALGSVRGHDPIRLFVYGARIGAIVGAVFGVLQLLDGMQRASGGMINPIPFGIASALFGCLSLIGAADEGTRGRILAGIAFAAGLGASFLSQSRGAWMALPVMVPILLVYFRFRLGTKPALIASAATAGLALVAVLAAGSAITDRFQETMVMFRAFDAQSVTPNTQSFSLGQRLLMWTYGTEAVADNPILGIGPHNAVDTVRTAAAADGYVIQPYSHLHNEYLTEAVGNGIVGLATLVLLLAAPVVTALRSARDSRYLDRLTFAVLTTTASALLGVTSLAFGNDILNTAYAGCLLAVCLSAVASGPKPKAAST